MFDLTFDLSVFDQFVTWEAGACLVCPSRADLLNPADFIRKHELTVWFSVPSVAMFMRRLGSLAPGSFSESALEPLLRRAAPGAARGGVERRRSGLHPRKPLWADGGHGRLYGLPLAWGGVAIRVHARDRPDRRTVPGTPCDACRSVPARGSGG